MKSNPLHYYPFIAILLFEALISFSLQTEIMRNGDITIHVNAAQRILEGEKLYRDIITVSFPMQFYQRIPGVLLAKWLEVNPIIIAVILDNCIALISMLLSLFILRRIPLLNHPYITCFLATILGYVMFILPVGDLMMGQKEYYYFLYTLPYFARAAARTEGAVFDRRLRIFIGLFSAIGFCYKPFCVIPLVMVEAYLCWIARSWRPLVKAEFIACAAVGLCYLLWIFFYFTEYFTVIGPLGKFYYHMRPDIDGLIRHYICRVLPFVLPTILLLIYNHYARPSCRHLVTVLCLTAIGYTLDGIVQLKNFMHHLYPAFGIAILLFAIVLVATWNLIPRGETSPAPALLPRTKMIQALAGALFCGIALLAHYINPNPVTMASGNEMLNQVINFYTKYGKRPPTTFYKLGYRIAPMFPQGIYREMTWDYHFYHLWLLSGIMGFKERHADESQEWIDEQTKDAENLLRKTVTDDMLRLKPDLLLVEHTNPDLIKYFSEEPRFFKLIQQYGMEGNVRGVDVYIRGVKPTTAPVTYGTDGPDYNQEP